MDIFNIDQLLPLVEKKPEFIVIQKGGYAVIDYVYQDKNTFDEPELMECRGIKFDDNGLILARPFAKFFNYGERDSVMPVHRPHVITEKMDGSMVHPVMIGKQFFLHTRKGHTDVAKKAERFMLSSHRDYRNFCVDALKDGWTPIFEYTGPNNRIVLRYDEENLSLLALRNTVTGTLMSFDKVYRISRDYGIPMVRLVTFQLRGQVQEFLDHTRALKNAEGYVIYFDNSYMLKIKAEDYVLKHRALDDLSSKQKVVALCAQGFMDDVLSILSDLDAAELAAFNDALQTEVNVLAGTARELASMVTDGHRTRKDFALHWAPRIQPWWLVPIIFGIIDGKDARMLTLKAVQKHYKDIGVSWRGQ